MPKSQVNAVEKVHTISHDKITHLASGIPWQITSLTDLQWKGEGTKFN